MADIQTIFEDDPFYKPDLADFRIVELRVSQRADGIQKRIESTERNLRAQRR